jgi:hypothetical protein
MADPVIGFSTSVKISSERPAIVEFDVKADQRTLDSVVATALAIIGAKAQSETRDASVLFAVQFDLGGDLQTRFTGRSGGAPTVHATATLTSVPGAGLWQGRANYTVTRIPALLPKNPHPVTDELGWMTMSTLLTRGLFAALRASGVQVAASPLLLAELRREPHATYAGRLSYAMIAAGLVNEVRAIDDLTRLAMKSPDAVFERDAVGALSSIDSPRATVALLQLLARPRGATFPVLDGLVKRAEQELSAREEIIRALTQHLDRADTTPDSRRRVQDALRRVPAASAAR